MKKSIFLLAFLLSMLWHVSAVAEKCDWQTYFCFGINWKTTTPADVQGINVQATDQNGYTPLHWAVAGNDSIDIINALIQADADTNAKDKTGRTPLHIATAGNDNLDIINALIQAGADINAKSKSGNTPLHRAALWNDDIDIITALIQAGADINAINNSGYTPLHRAALGNENLDIINTLIQAGADINAKSRSGNTPLHRAAEHNDNLDIITALIQAGADINAKNKDGYTAEDINRGAIKIALKVILKDLGGINWQTAVVADAAKVDLSARLPGTGETVLHGAAQYSTPEVVAALIAKGARIDSRDKDGATVLHAAVKSGNVGVFAVLHEKININAQDKNGNTPLHYAVFTNQQQAVLWLLKNGADATIFNARFKTPITYAGENADFQNSEAYWVLNDASYAPAGAN